MTELTQRMTNPAGLLPGAMTGIGHLTSAVAAAGVPEQTMELVHLRVSQINGCSACLYYGWRTAQRIGLEPERMVAVSAWRESPLFDDAERAALALAEAMTRLADRPDAVDDETWAAASRHFDEKQLAAIVLQAATVNLFNRINTTVRQAPVDSWT